MAKKSRKSTTSEKPLKLFYIFYNQERWNNWLNTLKDASFEVDPKSDEMPEGFRILDSFSEDITVEVLKIMKLYQNKRFSKDEAEEKLTQVEKIVMSDTPKGDLGDIIEILQLPKAALFAACRKYFSGNFEKDIKALVKRGRSLIDKDMEQALDVTAHIGANVIDGASCCGKYLTDDMNQPTLFDEWLIECERMSEAIASLKDFDEVAGEEM